IAAGHIDQFDQRLFDGGLVVGNQTDFLFPGRGQRRIEPVAQAGDALVLVDAAGGTVGNRNQADLDQVTAHASLSSLKSSSLGTGRSEPPASSSRRTR